MVAIVTKIFRTLNKMLPGRPIPYKDVVELGERLFGSIVLQAHANKIGSFILWTPDMIFICDDGRIKILDIGVQQVLEKAQNKAGSRLQCLMLHLRLLTDGKPVPASDLYSFGLILWEMLVGKNCEENDLYGTFLVAYYCWSLQWCKCCMKALKCLLSLYVILACTATNQGMRPSNAQVALQRLATIHFSTYSARTPDTYISTDSIIWSSPIWKPANCITQSI